ncbi:hypothetical protein KR026_000368 [Drosophila bipectinata]|nr:hypothetical protein KR026_000368 [Drosophila bipectinata]
MADFDSRLIELVRANPKLYEKDPRNTPYDAHKKQKTEIWRSIATSLKTDVNTCNTHWNNLVSKLRRELAKEKLGGPGSDWSLLPQMRFLQHRHHHLTSQHGRADVSWPEPKKGELLVEDVHDEYDQLQEAMDEQLAGTTVATVVAPASTAPTIPVRADLMKRIEALLEGLDTDNRSKAEKRILTYLCKCNLSALNQEPIDDINI